MSVLFKVEGQPLRRLLPMGVVRLAPRNANDEGERLYRGFTVELRMDHSLLETSRFRRQVSFNDVRPTPPIVPDTMTENELREHGFLDEEVWSQVIRQAVREIRKDINATLDVYLG